MSLLLDALKRAEQEKHARQPAAGAAPAATPPVSRLIAGSGPDTSLELQPLTSGTGAAPPPAGPRVDAAAYAAQNVFQAKTAESEAPRKRTVLWLAFGAVALVATAAAAYVWYSVSSLTPQYAGTPRPRAAPTPPPASGAPLPPTAAMGSIVPAPGQAMATQVPPEPAAGATAPTPPPAPVRESTAERLARAAAEMPAPPPLRMDRAAAEPRRVPGEVAAGYEALRRGDLAAARRSYEAALGSDPTSVDAFLGMATLAARSGNRAAASDYYRRALDLDSRNATALAGLAALADFSRPDALEAQLRADLARAPESAALHFTLGNLYAAQSRWSEAQAAYFEAHRLDPGSPDIAHNLAVSLDRLGQGSLAASFYRRALEGARVGAAQFDAAAVARRLEELR